MPRKIIHRFLPDISKLLNRSSLRWVNRLSHDPNLFHLNRHSVSLAVFVGIFCAFIPLPAQTIIAAFMCFWLGANLPIGLIVIWISNPVTIPPMFYLTHRLGSYLLGTAPTEFTMSLSWEWFSNLGAGVLLPLVAGSLLCGIVFATIGYFSIRYLWRWKVIKNWEARKDLRLKRKQGI
ncbi:MAG: DUF2062 domain-containing protein [Porticoccaceae bacterium]|jgi:uncharacterized protein|nr:DUF2062 domain-containing protein [Porticoccaceae bacterium]MBT5577364.1 DUF2062 domain-containing protein [Porticoccaceae bacterium]MBT7375861.1 DUF2062 domain-containing protein [Porticoccaceae bacterium]